MTTVIKNTTTNGITSRLSDDCWLFGGGVDWQRRRRGLHTFGFGLCGSFALCGLVWHFLWARPLPFALVRRLDRHLIPLSGSRPRVPVSLRTPPHGVIHFKVTWTNKAGQLLRSDDWYKRVHVYRLSIEYVSISSTNWYNCFHLRGFF